MFTGIVHELGEVVRVEPRDKALSITVFAEKTAPVCKIGDSVAVNGCCLTVERIAGLKLTFTAGSETVNNTTLSGFSSGQKVNIEPALTLNDRLGGHFVLGHIDGVGLVTNIDISHSGAYNYIIKLPDHFEQYIIQKGSIGIDGVSLTLQKFTFNPLLLDMFIIPQSYKTTIFQNYSIGTKVNFEIDHFAKLIWHMLEIQNLKNRI